MDLRDSLDKAMRQALEMVVPIAEERQKLEYITQDTLTGDEEFVFGYAFAAGVKWAEARAQQAQQEANKPSTQD